MLLKKIEANQEAHQEMEMTERRLRDILAEINAQVHLFLSTGILNPSLSTLHPPP